MKGNKMNKNTKNEVTVNESASVESKPLTGADLNLQILQKKVREPKKHKFADGEFVVPTHYYCTKCGAKLAVRQEVLIKRIEKQYNNQFKKYFEEAVCSSCKRENKQTLSDDAILAKAREIEAKRASQAEQKTETPKADPVEDVLNNL